MKIKTLPGPELKAHIERSIEGAIELIKRLEGASWSDNNALTNARENLRVAQRYLQMAQVKTRQHLPT